MRFIGNLIFNLTLLAGGLSFANAQTTLSDDFNFQGKKAVFGNLDSSIQHYKSIGEWKMAAKEVYLYTQTGKLNRKEKHLWSLSDTNWKLSTIFYYAYDPTGKLDQEVELGRFQNGWDTLQVRSISYNANNLPIGETIDKWSTTSNKFFRYSFRNTDYNAQGQVILDSNFFTNNEGQTYTGLKYDFSYRSTGQLESKVESVKYATDWRINNKSVYEFNANDTLVARHYYSYSPATQTWYYGARAEYLLDTVGNISRMQTFQNTDSSTYTPSLRLECDFDNSVPISNVAFPYLVGMEIQPLTLLNELVYSQYDKVNMTWDTNSRISFHYTKINTGLGENPNSLKFVVYPNPSKNKVNVQIEEAGSYHIRLYNLQGALVKEQNFEGNSHTLDIHSLTPGAYVLVIGNEGSWNRQKLIKY